MTEEKKSTYKGQTEARRKATNKYLRETVEEFKVRVPRGDKARIKAHAEGCGESLNGFVIRAIDETMARDNGGSVPIGGPAAVPNSETVAAMKEYTEGSGEAFKGSTADVFAAVLSEGD